MGRRGSTRRARILLQACVAIVSAVVLSVAGYGWSTYRALASSLVTSDVLGQSSTSGAPTVTALLVGVDSRTDAQGDPLPQAVLDAMHAGPDDGELNTDTIILLRIPADAGKPVVAVSFPRDSYVELAGDFGTHKINSAYGRAFVDARRSHSADGYTDAALDRAAREAGRHELVATVQQLTGVTVDHYAEVNLAGFVEFTDAVGGVPVCLTNPVDDAHYSGAVLPAGPQTLRGGDALAFVRQRHGLPDGDLDRITRQQAYLAGLAHSLLGSGILDDAAVVGRLLDVVTRYTVVDQGWDLDQLVAQASRLSAARVEFRTIPTLRPDLRTPDDGVAVEIDEGQVRAFVGAVLAGAPAPPTGSTAPTTGPTVRTGLPATPSTRAVVGTTTAPRVATTGTEATSTTSTTTTTTTTATPTTTPITGAAVPCVD